MRPAIWRNRSVRTRRATTGPGPATLTRWCSGSSPPARSSMFSTWASAPASPLDSSRRRTAGYSASKSTPAWPTWPGRRRGGGRAVRGMGPGGATVRRRRRRAGLALGRSGEGNGPGGCGAPSWWSPGPLLERVRASDGSGACLLGGLSTNAPRLAVQRRDLAWRGGVLPDPHEGGRRHPNGARIRGTGAVAVRVGRPYGRDECQDFVPTSGGHSQLPPGSWTSCRPASPPRSTPSGGASPCTTRPSPSSRSTLAKAEEITTPSGRPFRSISVTF